MRNILIIIMLLPALAIAQTHIYRSVQPGVTAAIGTSTGTLTISGSTATFSVEQPDSVGVGDAIQYDSDGNGSIDAICFVHSRTLPGQQYTVKTATGGTPPPVTGDEDWDIFRAYTSWLNMEAGTENSGIDISVRSFDAGNRNLEGNTEIWNVAFYPGVENANIIWDWQTTPTYYIRFFTPYLESDVGRSMRHSGVISSRCYKIENASTVFTHTGTAGTSFGLKIDGLQFSKGNGVGSAISFERSETNGKEWVSNCVIELGSYSTSGLYGISVANGSSRTFYLWNNIVYGGGNINTAFRFLSNSGTGYVYNNTAADVYEGFYMSGSGQAELLINNIAQVTGAGSDGYIGTFSASSNYNISNIGSDAPGANSMQITLSFVDAVGRNYHLTSGDAETAIGTDLSGDSNLSFTTDIDGQTRSVWHIGADEYFAPAGGSNVGVFFLRRRAK